MAEHADAQHAGLARRLGKLRMLDVQQILGERLHARWGGAMGVAQQHTCQETASCWNLNGSSQSAVVAPRAILSHRLFEKCGSNSVLFLDTGLRENSAMLAARRRQDAPGRGGAPCRSPVTRL